MKNYTLLFLSILVVMIGCKEGGENNNEPNNKKDTIAENTELKFQEEERKCFDLLKNNPNDFSANYNFGRLYYNEAVKSMGQADSIKYKKLINDPNSLDLPLNAFFYTLSFDDIEGKTFALFNRAIVYFEKANSIDPTNQNALTGLSGCYFSQGQMEKFEKLNRKPE